MQLYILALDCGEQSHSNRYRLLQVIILTLTSSPPHSRKLEDFLFVYSSNFASAPDQEGFSSYSTVPSGGAFTDNRDETAAELVLFIWRYCDCCSLLCCQISSLQVTLLSTNHSSVRESAGPMGRQTESRLTIGDRILTKPKHKHNNYLNKFIS